MDEKCENREAVTEMPKTHLEYLMDFERTSRRQANNSFLVSIIGFAIGIVLIGFGAVFAYSKIGDLPTAFLIIAGILSETVSVCFGFAFFTLTKQNNFLHRLISKKEQFYLLMQAAEGVDNKEEMLMTILESSLNADRV